MAVMLDIGGFDYKTSISTLTSVPDSFFARMFSGDWQNEKDVEGRVFIDRDGETFKYVLDFFRNGNKMVLPSDKETRDKIKVEAQFFALPQLEKIIDDDNDSLPVVHWPVTKHDPETKLVHFRFEVEKSSSLSLQPSKSYDVELPLEHLRRDPDSYFYLLADKIIKGTDFKDEYCEYHDNEHICDELVKFHQWYTFKTPRDDEPNYQYNVMLLIKFLELGPIAIREKDIKGDIRDLLRVAARFNLASAVRRIDDFIKSSATV